MCPRSRFDEKTVTDWISSKTGRYDSVLYEERQVLKVGSPARGRAGHDIENAREVWTLCMLACHSGLRLGDCCLLSWDEVDLVARRIVRIPLKTRRRPGARPAVIPLHDEILARLTAIRPDGASGYVCPRKAAQYLRNRSGVTDAFMTLFRQAGIRLYAEGTGPGTDKRAAVEVGFHSFRHTFVTQAKHAGIDRASVEAIVGWGSPAMERNYTHVSESHLQDGISRKGCVLPSEASVVRTPVA